MLYDTKLGDDYVIGEHWKDAANALLGLLMGELGHLDGGTIDRQIRDMAEKAGVDLEK